MSSGLAWALVLTFMTPAPDLTQALPTDRFLVHMYGRWQYPPPEIELRERSASATIVVFSSNGEYVEHSCLIIDNLNGELGISAGDGHTVAVGTWVRRDDILEVHRERVYRFVERVGPGPDELCDPSVVEYKVDSRGVRQGKKRFRINTGLDVPDWQAYVSDARGSSIVCGG